MSDLISPMTKTPDTVHGMPRRTALAAGLWSVPVIVAVTATPAHATSGDTVSLRSAGMRVLAAGASRVTATVVNGAGAPVAGRSVSFTGPSGTTFSPASAVTDGAGEASTDLDLATPWAIPGTQTTATAVSTGASSSASFTVQGANAYGVGLNASSMLGTPSSGNQRTATQLSLAFVSPVVQLAAGGTFSLALLQDGTVWAVGSNSAGQLGDGTTTTRTAWTQVVGLSGVTAISAGYSTALAVVGGQVWGWGSGANEILGTGGSRTAPAQLFSLTGVTQVALGNRSGYALAGGDVWAWGANTYGQLGDGTTTSTGAPVQVVGVANATQLIAGYDGAYALSGGSVSAWGRGDRGQIGNGSSANSLTAAAVSTLSNVSQIAASSWTGYAIVSGSVWAWGYGGVGSLGNGSTSDALQPVAVTGLSGVTDISGGGSTGYALSASGVSAWGYNQSGQVGDGTTTTRSTPVAVSGTASIKSLGMNSPTNSAMFFVR